MRRQLAISLAFAVIGSCGGDEKTTESSASSATASTDAPTTVDSTVAETTTTPSTDPPPIATLPADQVAQLVAERPYNIVVPSSYDAATPIPLVIGLHGYRGSSALVEEYIQLTPLAEEYGFVYVLPEGTKNEVGEQLWNATDGCCGGSSTVDDSTYLRAVIDDLKAKLNIDPKRVYIFGHSNGGFMAYRMACDHADAIAAIVSIAGAAFVNPSDCAPTEPVSVLQVHGTADTVIEFDGGTYVGPYPSALQTVDSWSAYDQCTDGGDIQPYDQDPLFAGVEAQKLSYGTCAADTTVELWILDRAGHVPIASLTMFTAIEFLLAHPKA